MDKTVTIIRHAPTEYNKKCIFMGTADIPAAYFDSSAFARIREDRYVRQAAVLYASPLLRAYDTASMIANNEKPVVTDSRLIERCLGDWQGLPKDQVKSQYPKAFSEGKMDVYFTPPGGEPYDQLVLRAASFITEQLRAHEHLVLVTHNGVFRVMKSLLTGKSLRCVFSEYEPYLTPQTFVVTDELIDVILQNPFYTSDV